MSPPNANLPGFHCIDDSELNNVYLVKCKYQIAYKKNVKNSLKEVRNGETAKDWLTFDI